jgi:hypothetical protein
MSPRARSLALGCALALLAGTALAQAFRLDDSTSPRSRVEPRLVVDETGQALQRALEPEHAVLRFGPVVYRLDLRPHLGQRARIYFVRGAEPGPPSGTRLLWALPAGQASGALLGGERALLWSGQVNQAWMEITLNLDLDIPLQHWRPRPGPGGLDLATHFELERFQ